MADALAFAAGEGATCSCFSRAVVEEALPLAEGRLFRSPPFLSFSPSFILLLDPPPADREDFLECECESWVRDDRDLECVLDVERELWDRETLPVAVLLEDTERAVAAGERDEVTGTSGSSLLRLWPLLLSLLL